MRVMFAVAVLLSGIACIGEAEAQACDRDCNRCLVYARGECVKRGADPACEARRKKCLERRTGAPKSTTTTAPRPTVRQRQQQIQQQGRPQMPAPTVVPPAPKSVPTVIAPAPKSAPTVVAPAPKSAPTVVARRLLFHRHPASYLHEYICAPPTYRHPQLVHMASWPFVPNRRRQIGNDYSGRALPTARVCRHRKRCLALSHQAIKCSRSGPSTNPTQATH